MLHFTPISHPLIWSILSDFLYGSHLKHATLAGMKWVCRIALLKTYILNICTQSPILAFRKEENKTHGHIQKGKNQREINFKGHSYGSKIKGIFFSS